MGVQVTVIAAMISACRDPSGGGIDAPAPDGADPDGPDPAMLATCRGTVDFGSVGINSSSALATFTVTNVGHTTSGTVMTNLIGASAASFEMVGTTCTTLEPGATCTVSTRFRPTVFGVAHAGLTLTASPGGSVTIALVATGRSTGGIYISPPGIQSFGTVATGSASADVTYTITNAGDVSTGAMTVALGGANPNDFAITSQTCSGTMLAAGASCTIDIQFVPTLTGPRSAVMTATVNPGGSVTASLSGSAVGDEGMIISPSGIDFGISLVGVTSASQELTVINQGGAATGVLAATLAGAAPADFALATDTCTGVALAPGVGCVMTVTFTPLTSGSRSAVLRLTGNPGGSTTASLLGTGTM